MTKIAGVVFTGKISRWSETNSISGNRQQLRLMG